MVIAPSLALFGLAEDISAKRALYTCDLGYLTPTPMADFTNEYSLHQSITTNIIHTYILKHLCNSWMAIYDVESLLVKFKLFGLG